MQAYYNFIIIHCDQRLQLTRKVTGIQYYTLQMALKGTPSVRWATLTCACWQKKSTWHHFFAEKKGLTQTLYLIARHC